jgi:hypothetical protein
MSASWRFCACGCTEWHLRSGLGVSCSHNPVQLVGRQFACVPAGDRGCGDCLEMDEQDAVREAAARMRRVRVGRAEVVGWFDEVVQLFEDHVVDAQVADMIAEGGPVHEEKS